MAQMVKNPPAMWKTRVRSLGWEDTLEKEMATRSSILAWRIPGTEEPSELRSMGNTSIFRGCGGAGEGHWECNLYMPLCPLQGFLPHQLPPVLPRQRCRLPCPLHEGWWQ